jgi:FtsP/CotA-like multicopper oxidase with cupredoxin domain
LGVTTDRRAFIVAAGATVAGAIAVGAVGAVKAAHPTPAPAVALDGVDEPQFAELTPFTDALPVPVTLSAGPEGITEVEMVEAHLRLHSQLPPTRMWTYAGHFPGPTIETRKDQPARIAWTNKLTGTSPVKGVWIRPDGPGAGRLPYNKAGSQGAYPRPELASLTPWTTVHLHGGHQNAASDGATEYGVTPGHSQLCEYPNEVAAHLFYHDHAMSVTALNVISGLVGNYFVRDPDEQRLNLPSGRYEIPLAIADVNFETDSRGNLTGELLAKRVLAPTDLSPAPGTIPRSLPFYGPFTMVNGVVWPHLDVQARQYRFRLVNSSANRPYRLAIIDEQTREPIGRAMTVIGTDLGLLGQPLVIDQTLALAPAERADIVIDFAAHAGRRLTLVNTDAGAAPGTPVPAVNIPYPAVMQFRVAQQAQAGKPLPAVLAPDFRRLSASDVPAGAVERFVMTAYDPSGSMPQLWEMQDLGSADPGDGPVVEVALPGGIRRLSCVATNFDDTTSYFAEPGDWEKWTFINVVGAHTSISHPMHIHLMNFQIIDRRSIDSSGLDFASGATSKPITMGNAVAVRPEESGWKDTVNVAAGTAVTVAGQFSSRTGKVMYHCHYLDHEDEGMMRPIVIMPAAINRLRAMQMAMMDRNAPMVM